MVAVARGRPGGLAVEVAVGDSHAARLFVTSDQHLASNKREGDVVNPYAVVQLVTDFKASREEGGARLTCRYQQG